MDDENFPEQVRYCSLSDIDSVHYDSMNSFAFIPQVRELSLNLHRILLDTVKMQEFQDVSTLNYSFVMI